MHHIARKTEYPAGNAVITEGLSPFSVANSLLKKETGCPLQIKPSGKSYIPESSLLLDSNAPTVGKGNVKWSTKVELCHW